MRVFDEDGPKRLASVTGHCSRSAMVECDPLKISVLSHFLYNPNLALIRLLAFPYGEIPLSTDHEVKAAVQSWKQKLNFCERNEKMDFTFGEVANSNKKSINDENMNEKDFESNGSVGLEREEGDEQERVANKKVADNKDKKNPPYIPKSGTFYEHDDRLANKSNANRVEQKVEKQKKERWSHDRYNDNEQAPKSRSELMSIYGYDIRNECGPRKARRGRRYGRGPKNYTRLWKNAFKAIQPIEQTKTNIMEEYPPLSENNEEKRQSNITESSFPPNERHDSKNKEREPPIEHTSHPKHSHRLPDQKDSSGNQSNVTPAYQGTETGCTVKSKQPEIQLKDYRDFTKSRESSNCNSKSEQAVSRAPRFGSCQDYNANEMEILEQDVYQINIQDHSSEMSNKQQSKHCQNNVPLRLQVEESDFSNCYSSLRQCSLQETPIPNYTEAVLNYYLNEYSATTAPPTSLPQPTTLNAPTEGSDALPPPLVTPVSGTSNPILQPPSLATIFPQGTAPFLSPFTLFFPKQAPPYQGYPQFNAVHQALPKTHIPNYTQAPNYYPNEYIATTSTAPSPSLPQHHTANAPAQTPSPPSATLPQSVSVTSNSILQAFASTFPQVAAPFLSQPVTTSSHQGYQQFNTNQTELYQCEGRAKYSSTQGQQLDQGMVPQKRPKIAFKIAAPSTKLDRLGQ